MEKELKSCMGVLLRADLTGHGQFSQLADFCQKGWDDRPLLSALKKTPVQEFNYSSITFFYFISTT